MRLMAVLMDEIEDFNFCIPDDPEDNFLVLFSPVLRSFLGFLSRCWLSDISCSPTTIVILYADHSHEKYVLLFISTNSRVFLWVFA